MGDMGDYWNDHKEYKQSIKNKWEPRNRAFIHKWADDNLVEVDEFINGSQERLIGRQTLDIWPQWLKWHNVTTGERGQCHNQNELKLLLEKIL